MKKTFTTLALALVLTFGATFANAGIIVSDKSGPTTCTNAENSNDGIIIFGKDGIIIFGIVIFGGKDAPCKDTGGIIVSDITGIIVSD